MGIGQTRLVYTNGDTGKTTDDPLPAAPEETTQPADNTDSKLPANTAIQGENTAPNPSGDTAIQGDNAVSAQPGDTAIQGDNTASAPPGDTAIQGDNTASAPPDDSNIQGNEAASVAQLPGVSNETVQKLQLGTDAVNLDTARLAQKAGVVQNIQKAGQEESGAFDEFPPTWNEEKDGGTKPDDFPDDIWDLKKEIGKLREGNLYKAVLLARELKHGRSNPIAMGKARRYLSKASRISSTVLDSASDANKAFASTVGIASTIDREGKYKTALQGAALVSNFISLVTTSRDIFLKIKNFRGGNGIDKLFKVVALCGDLATWLSKACSIAKTITNYFGAGNKIPGLKEATKWIILALNMGSQLAGIANASRGIHKGRKNHKRLEEQKENLWNSEIKQIVEEHGVSEEAPDEKGEETSQKDGAEKETGKDGTVTDLSDPEEPKDKNAPGDESKEVSRYGRSIAVERLLSNPNHLTEEEKDKLIRYLALDRRAEKVNLSLITTSSGLVTSVIGLCSSLFTATVYGASYSEKAASKMPGVGTAGMSVVTNGAVIGNILIKTYIKIDSNRGDSRKDLITDSLFEKLGTLGEEQYGLKGLESELEKKSSGGENKNTAENVVKMYDKAETQFQYMGVDYGALLKAHDQDAFKKILAAGV